jgi:phage baseplate assembly protein V
MSVRRLLVPVHRRIRNLTARGTVQLSDASKLLQSLQITLLKDEVLDNVEHFEPLGLTSRPKQGAEVLVLCPGGNRSSAIAVMVSDRRIRIKDLAEGEVAIYDDAGNLIQLKQDGTIAVTSSTSVDVTAPNVTMSGNLTVSGNVHADGSVSDATSTMQAMRDAHNTHNHPTAPTGPVSLPSVLMV